TVMRNGGVAILGSGACGGEDRAQRTIEEALTSPLLNDNEIRGAKWILININSSEGEHEFTMDEVEIIQNYLLTQAGEGTDVILGMGYDNSLGDKIGITLIATGFEHKDPFMKSQPKSSQPKKDEKIILTLGGTSELKDSQKPVIEKSNQIEIAAAVKEELAPAILAVAVQETVSVEILQLGEHSKNTVEKIVEKIDTEDKIEWILSQPIVVSTESIDIPSSSLQNNVTENSSPVPAASGGYLAKPSNIYAEPKIARSVSDQSAESAVVNPVQEEDPSSEMQLVFKDDIPAAEEPRAHQIQQPVTEMPSVEEPALQDEAEIQRQRAAERIQKLRNLSFNINAADPNNEFETVPAYIRRNLELYNSISHVENFYSNYEVKTDENNNTQISTINTFLDGKKPD
ncbi:MAG: cell division protein FtsZ, partial [Flavitalea sp.]